LPASIGAQGLRTVIESHKRVFPDVGAGVAALKRGSDDRYYILARPATTISVYSADGNLIGHIPNAASGPVIRYAVDIALTPSGLIAVADRGANSIEVFRPDGSLVSRTPVVAPTSVVALSDSEFAVTSLISKRLVEVIDKRGNVLRGFGDPSEIGDDAGKATLHDFGTISGDSAAGIYFAFTSMPDPTLRKYDPYGYLAYESLIPKREFEGAESQPVDRVQLLFGFSDLSFSHQSSGWLSIGSSHTVKFGGDIGTGLGESIRRGFGLGDAIQRQTTGQPGSAGGPVGATFSGEANGQRTSFQLGMGRTSGFGGRGISRMGFGQFAQQTTDQGGVLQFSDSNGNSGEDDSDFGQASDSSGASGTTAELGMFGSDDSQTPDSSDALASPQAGASAMSPMGLPAPFLIGSTLDSLYFRPRGLSESITSGGPSGRPGRGPGGAHSSAGGAGGGPGAGNFSHFGYHGRFNSGVPAFTAALRVNLGDLGRPSAADKPEITAVAVDPQTHDVWAAIGGTLVHFSGDGNPVGIYYLTLAGGSSLKPTALLVEPDRLLIAADPWGIFEFARPDKPASTQPERFNIAPQVVSQPR
jgi:hypothetical protein